ncbi:MAG: HEPN domain-containing protein [Candidatus Cloacimonetes bacterium]|nr:HEPN domain-containing protein [Candidatus Cloacimonadota bacterium]MBL7085554.1 HEPN domain-containing protein [Candidatus Cloacimonadota bacterium]
MKKRNPEEVELMQNWLSYAKENLLTAKTIITEEFSPYHTVCFMCQGSVEKYIKAYLIWNGWILEKIHDLEDLLTHAIDFDSEFATLREDCKLLNKYITEEQYPGDLPFEAIGEKDAKEAIKAADKISKFVLKRIKFTD